MLKIVRRLMNRCGLDIRRIRNAAAGPQWPVDFSDDHRRIIEQVAPYTYTSPERIQALCSAVDYLVRERIAGSIVECGVWKGGSAMAAMLSLLGRGAADRQFWLYDTYEGMTRPSQEDVSIGGRDARAIYDEKQRSGEAWVMSSLEEVQQNLQSTGYPKSLMTLVQGKVEETIPGQTPDSIALLRLDTDWYESTRHELEHLYPRLSPGGILIIDDYGEWKGARKAVDEYFAKQETFPFLSRIDYTGRIAVKR